MSNRGRCRPLRVESNEFLWFVSSRTVEERFWLLPLLDAGIRNKGNRSTRRALDHYERRSDRRIARLVARANAKLGPYQPRLDVETAKKVLRDLVGSAIARAQEKYGVRIYAIVVMGNHIHLVVSTPNKNLRSFMGYVKARIASGTNWLHGRRGPLWGRRYDAEPILDDEAAQERVGYTIGNSIQSDLVDTVEEWPGLCVAYGLGGVTEMSFRYLDRVAWHRARRPENLAPFVKTAELRLSPLPEMEGRSVAELSRAIAVMIREREQKERQRRQDVGKSVLGLERLAATNFEERPRAPKRSRRPYCHVSCPRRRAEHFQHMSALLEAYAHSAERFRAGEADVRFPSGTYPPPLPVAA